MEDIVIPIAVCGMLFIGMPWIVLHYLLSWKKNAGLSAADETLMDELYETARRLDERLHTIERIIAADQPDPRRPDAGITGRAADVRSAAANRE